MNGWICLIGVGRWMGLMWMDGLIWTDEYDVGGWSDLDGWMGLI